MIQFLFKRTSVLKRSFLAVLLTVVISLSALFPPARFPFGQVIAIPVAQTSANFGETSILSNDDWGNANMVVAQQAFLSQDASLQSLSFYVTKAVGQLSMGIYSDTGGNPGALLAQTAIFTPTVGWNTKNVVTPVNLAAGTYWLAYFAQSNSLHFRLANNGTARWFRTSFGTMPANFSTSPQTGSYHWSFYATVLVNAAPTYTPTQTPTVTNTPVQISSPTPIATDTPIPVNSATPTATETPIPVNSPTPTATETPIPVNSPTSTATDTPIPISSPTPTTTNTPIPLNSPTPTSTNTPIPVNSPTPTATPSVAAGGFVFQSASQYTVGSGPTNVVIGDLNGDGKPDLAVANYGTTGVIGNTVSVLRNTGALGSISFAPKVDFTVNAGPHGIAMADLDGDGKPDLVITQYGAYGMGSTVSVLPNTSSGGSISFAARQEYSTGGGPHDIAIGDLDGDGRLDLAVTNFSDGNGSTVSVIRNTSTVGNISFAAGQIFTVGSGPYGIALGDINGDGRADLVVSNNGYINGSGNTITVLQNTTTGPGNITFAPKADFLANSGPREIVLRDLDKDSRLDVAVGNFGNYNGTTLSILRNTSSGGVLSLAAKLDLPVGPAPHGLAGGDLDSDGLTDLVVTNYGSGDGTTISLLQNHSSSGIISFATRQDLTSGTGPHGTAVSDLDGDGKQDVVVTNYGTGNGNTISVLQNLTTQPLVMPTPSPTVASVFPSATPTNGPLPSSTPTATATNSPLPSSTPTNAPVPSSTPTSTVSGISFAPASTFTVGSGPTDSAAGDLNGDGKVDVAVAIYGNPQAIGNTVAVLMNNSTLGSISFAPRVEFTVNAGPHGIAMGDLDGDGKPDLVVTNYGAYASGSTVTVLRNTSTGSISFEAGKTFQVGNGPLGITLGDLDGDGKLDVAVANFNDGVGNSISVLHNTSTIGSINFDTWQTFTTNGGPYGVAVGDLNGDGRLDLVVGNNGSLSGSGTTVSVFVNTSSVGAVSFASKADFQVNSGPRIVTLRDLDKDGRLDVAVNNFGNYNGTTLSILLNTSSEGFLSLATKLDLSVGPAPHGLAGGDLDSDGLTDLVVTNFGSGDGSTVSVLKNGSSSGIISFATRQDLTSGSGPIGVTLGDLDGDGKQDIVSTNYGTGNGSTISVLLNQSP